MTTRVEVHRSNTTKARFALYTAGLGRRGEQGSIAAGRVLLDFSLEIVPRDTTALADSACITQVGHGLDTIIYVGYGLRNRPGTVIYGPGNDFSTFRYSPAQEKMVHRIPANYAWVQHFNHTLKHPNGGRANFLGEPSNTRIPEMAAAFRARFKEG